jgi:hypothetical protein
MPDPAEAGIETLSKKRKKPKRPLLSFQEIIEMGEYNPEILSIYPEWHLLSSHAQLQYIRRALDNRMQQLLTQWAEINNVLDFSLKPHLKEALRNIERQMKKLDADKERLYLEYSSKL